MSGRLAPTADEAGHLRAAAERDAKNPVLSFEDDTEAKARRATALSRELAERWIRPVHNALDAGAPPRGGAVD